MPLMTYQRGEGSSPQRVFLAIPAGDGKIHVPCVASLVDGVRALTAAGIGVDTCFESGNCHVDDARNSLVRQFLATDCTDLVFIDADVGFRAEDLVRLVTFDRDVVAGVYPKKQEPESFPVMVESGKAIWSEDDGCVEVIGAPTGFLRIRRSVLERMTEAFKHRSFIGQDGAHVYTLLFEREIADGRRWSGDYNWCRRWRALGGKIYVAPEMEFTHEGLKQWSGSLGAHWRREHGVDAADKRQAFAQAIGNLKSGEATPEDFSALVDAWANPWAASPEFLAVAYRMAKEASGPVLECGSGLSTVVMAAAGAEVHSLEHDPIWATAVRDTLADHGLTATVDCHPLRDGWYRAPAGEYPLVVIDGPPRNQGSRARAFEHVGGKALVDDTDDPAIAALVRDFAKGRDVRQCGDGSRRFSVIL